jgi:signal transduction histidine kinase
MANLLGNAAKVTPVGGSISVKAIITNANGHAPEGDEQRWLQVSVADSGGGIADKDLDRVFDRFYQAERPLIQGLGETGVGLSIVKYLIEAHGGKVWLETEMGRGSIFYFKLAIPDYYNDPWQEIDVPPLDLSPDDPADT